MIGEKFERINADAGMDEVLTVAELSAGVLIEKCQQEKMHKTNTEQ